ncbi:LacI family DNA-binding transcriptional regulator [Paenibacillus dokdonensis]|uniref:LacI family DNA-binding transcriptional regulator n=1 Tax=Paenibacillus dokdonensis TaxID=2567944 RepID=A0ABU6GH45_9BACL|nr:LacI family DNA-binding transcriptional regulator [Paenibacillus dokdonensis]MEC0238694.1 LacI family DNA-binding transcriptional regulator [Paenibacillus dokdonensis]
MASIHDVAKEAGVSVATVSKVINHYPDVSEKTRKKVKNAIELLRYRPNVIARGLVTGRSWTVGVLINIPFTNPYVSMLLEGIKTALENSGYDLMRLSARLNDPGYSFVDHCQSRNLDGVVVFGVEKDHHSIQELIESGIPTMFVDMDATGQRAGNITTENRNGVHMAVRHLYELGHQRIAYLAGVPGQPVNESRLAGYRDGLETSSIPYREDYVVNGDYSYDSGIQGMRMLLQLDQPPTAVVCTSDMAAFGVIHAIEAHGLSVPGDISVVGFDNIYEAELFKPGLTTINQNIHAIGVKSIEELISMIKSAEYPPPVVTEPSSLVIRESTARYSEQ